METEDFDDDTLNQVIDLSNTAEKSFADEEDSPGLEHIEVLSKYFGHKAFRPLQWKIISAVIKDRRDVCAVMCTGYGKSVCFQYPSIFMGGITLVISPLISLMEDQIVSLKVSNIPACLLGSAQKNQGQVIDEIFKNMYRLVYLTPEFCSGEFGKDLLKRMYEKLTLTLIAIDEAHCISSWGHDFRHQYRQLGLFHNLMPKVPIMAVTATATSRIRDDIINSLNLRNPLLVVSGFNRPNLYFQVHAKGANRVYKDLTKAMTYTKLGWNFSGSTIVYCNTRKQTEEVSEVLKCAGIKCRPYHAGLPLQIRQETYEEFIRDKIGVIVATVAFGMGIDKPDIRNVIHYGAFKSIENYYQEVGRAGRDGLPANCVTFYNNADFVIIRNMETSNPSKQSWKAVENYLTMRQCRRRFILDYFEDKSDDLSEPQANCCDNCTMKLSDSRADHEKYEGIEENGCYDFTRDARLLLQTILLLRAGLGMTTYILFLRGSNSKRISENVRNHSLHGAGKDHSLEWWKTLGKLLIQEKYLEEQLKKMNQGFSYSAIAVTSKGSRLLQEIDSSDDFRLLLPPPVSILKLLKSKPRTDSEWLNVKEKIEAGTSKSLNTESETDVKEKMDLYHKLLGVRADLAGEYDCMPYTIASNTALMKMAKFKPKNVDELRHLNLDGFTEAKVVKFARKFLKIINTILEVKPEEKKSIEDVLVKHPLPENAPMGLSAEVSCALFKSGFTVGEIAVKRGVTVGTITSHLSSGIRFGYQIKMVELGVTEEIRDAVIKIFSKNYTSFVDVSKKQIKEQCPPEITYEQINIVLAYLQVRLHLQNLDIPYEEFEDFYFNEIMAKGEDDSDQRLDALISFANQMKDGEESDEDLIEPPSKRDKIDCHLILESPPPIDVKPESASCISDVNKQSENEVDKTLIPKSVASSEVKNIKKSKKLPPWLSTKKVN